MENDAIDVEAGEFSMIMATMRPLTSNSNAYHETVAQISPSYDKLHSAPQSPDTRLDGDLGWFRVEAVARLVWRWYFAGL